MLCLSVLSALCSCGGDKEKKIAVIVKSSDSEFWQVFKSGVYSAATEYNVTVTFESPKNEEDYASQNKLISKAVDNGADAIVLSAIDRTRSAPTVNAAVRKGVKVITADSSLDSQFVSLFIGTDNPNAGAQAAKAVDDHCANGEKIRIGIVGSTEKTENLLQRENGLREYLKNRGGVEITASVTAESNRENAEAAATLLLREHPEINAVVGLNEWATLGIGYAVKTLGLSERVCAVGFDTNRACVEMLETGEMKALIVQNPFAMGYLGVEKAVEILSGTAQSEKTVYTAVTTVTRENMYNSDIQKMLFAFKK